MADSKMLNDAKDFAVSIIEICRVVKERRKESALTSQLIRSGTSIGANIYESKYGQSTADFVSKMKIALKECYETEYWLDILHDSKCITDEEYKPLFNKCGSIRRMLISSINTATTK